MENQQPEKPRAVTMAVYLLWGSLVLAVLRLALDWTSLSAAPKAMLVAGVIAVVFALYAFLYAMISAGRNWARIMLLVLVAADVILSMPNVANEFGRAPLVSSLAIGASGLQVFGLFLLFTSPGKTWFQKARAPEQGSMS